MIPETACLILCKKGYFVCILYAVSLYMGREWKPAICSGWEVSATDLEACNNCVYGVVPIFLFCSDSDDKCSRIGNDVARGHLCFIQNLNFRIQTIEQSIDR